MAGSASARRLLAVLAAYAKALAPDERDVVAHLALFPAGPAWRRWCGSTTPASRRSFWEAEHGLALGRVAAARAEVEGNLAGLSELGWDGHRAHAETILGDVALAGDEPDPDRASDHLAHARGWTAVTGEVEAMLHCHALAARICLAERRFADADSAIRSGLALSETHGFGLFAVDFNNLRLARALAVDVGASEAATQALMAARARPAYAWGWPMRCTWPGWRRWQTTAGGREPCSARPNGCARGCVTRGWRPRARRWRGQVNHAEVCAPPNSVQVFQRLMRWWGARGHARCQVRVANRCQTKRATPHDAARSLPRNAPDCENPAERRGGGALGGGTFGLEGSPTVPRREYERRVRSKGISTCSAIAGCRSGFAATTKLDVAAGRSRSPSGLVDTAGRATDTLYVDDVDVRDDSTAFVSSSLIEERKMTLERIANRAPDFAAMYGSKAEFLARKRVSAAPCAKEQSIPPFEGLEMFRVSGRLPGGFSNRMLSHEIIQGLDARIVSEHEGLVDTLLIAVPRGDPALSSRNSRHYKALFLGLGEWCRYLVLCDPANKDEILAIAMDAGLKAEHITFAFSPRFDYTIWAQDAYVALNDSSGGKILLEGVSFPRGDDMTIADDVAAQADVSALQSYLYFQGGNVLGGSELTLVGMDYVQHNVSRYDLETEEKVLESYARSLGTEILPLGGELYEHYEWYDRGILSGHGHQPIFHIDMYVTPTGVKGTSGKEIVFLGRPEAARKVVGRYSDVGELDDGKYNSLFDQTEQQLATRFEVRYLPLWITKSRLAQPKFKERYYNLTFNNCIVQSNAAVKRVLLPMYSEDSALFGTDKALREALEQAAVAEWKAIGYEVKIMDGLEELAYGSGSVHCITKTLARRA